MANPVVTPDDCRVVITRNKYGARIANYYAGDDFIGRVEEYGWTPVMDAVAHDGHCIVRTSCRDRARQAIFNFYNRGHYNDYGR